jgi:hypothetical protein
MGWAWFLWRASCSTPDANDGRSTIRRRRAGPPGHESSSPSYLTVKWRWAGASAASNRIQAGSPLTHPSGVVRSSVAGGLPMLRWCNATKDPAGRGSEVPSILSRHQTTLRIDHQRAGHLYSSGLSNVQGCPFHPMSADAGVSQHSTVDTKIALFRSLFRGRDDLYARRFESRRTGKIRLQSRLRERMGARRVRQTGGQVPRLSESAIPAAQRRNHSPASDRRGCERGASSSAAFTRCSSMRPASFWPCRFRQGGLARRHRRRSRDLPTRWGFPWPSNVRARATAATCGCSSPRPCRRFWRGNSVRTCSPRRWKSDPEIGLDSYDRFFPNQDTLPKGGFGNLIALPLQKRPRASDDSVFVDDDLLPWPDQWAFLSAVRKGSPVR